MTYQPPVDPSPPRVTPGDRRTDPAAIAAALFLAAEMVSAIILDNGPVALLRYLGAACGLAALPLMFLPIFTLQRHGSVPPGASYMGTTETVERGLFAVVRHPQYTGYLLLAATFALTSQHPVTIGCAAAGAVSVARWGIREERALRERFGATYDAYARRVPRFNLVAGLIRYARRAAAPPT